MMPSLWNGSFQMIVQSRATAMHRCYLVLSAHVAVDTEFTTDHAQFLKKAFSYVCMRINNLSSLALGSTRHLLVYYDFLQNAVPSKQQFILRFIHFILVHASCFSTTSRPDFASVYNDSKVCHISSSFFSFFFFHLWLV
jgi:hypothetical protein